jgi:transposase
MKLTKQQKKTRDKEIIELYFQGTTPKELAKRFELSHDSSVNRIVRKNGYKCNQAAPKVTDEQIKIIIEQYVSGISSEIIARNLGINGSTVCRKLTDNGIKIRPPEENKKKYPPLDKNYFETIDTEEKAYFLGLMYADGSLKFGSHEIKLALKEIDIDILERLSHIIYGFRKLESENRDVNGKIIFYYRLVFYDGKMYSDLTKHGCPPRKTFTITFPTFLSDKLLQHFIRGYFDGDGCICSTDITDRVDISSTYQFILGIHNYINNVVGITTLKANKNIVPNGVSGSFQIKKTEDITAFMEYLYKDATIYMQRKYNTFQEFKKKQANKKNKKEAKTHDTEKYGTFYIPTVGENQLTEKYMKGLSEEKKTEIANAVFSFYREGGFPYPIYSNDDLIRDFNALKNTDVANFMETKNIPIFNAAGVNIFKHFASHFWETISQEQRKKSMLDTFYDDEKFMSAIKNRVDEGYCINGNMIRRGLKNSRIAYCASIFFPVVAKTIYSKYCQEGDIIYDYSMGFGQRLLGALSLPFNVKYVGVDPFEKSYNSNVDIFKFFNSNVPMMNKTVDLVCDGSENFCKEEYVGKVKLAFSSPPYFNLEVYNNGENQAYSDNDYCSFINVWWRKTVANAVKLLQDDGIFALNIKDKVGGFNIEQDMCGVLMENGFREVDRLQIQLSRNTIFMNSKGEHKFEPIIVFQKNNNNQ